jgi:hypothetical protein
MSTAPRGRSSQRRGRCKCGGGAGDLATCCFNPLRSFFRCPGRGRGRSSSKHRQRTPSRVRDALTPPGGGVAQHQQGHEEEEPSFFVYAMPKQGGGGGAGHDDKKKKKKKHRKACVPSLGSCFRRKNKKERKAARAAAATVTDRLPALTPASSMLTHPPGSPVPDKSQAVTPSMTQPPSPAPTENTSVANSPAPPGPHSAVKGVLPATQQRPGKQSTDSARSPFELQMQRQQQSTTDSAWSPFALPQSQKPAKNNNVEGIEIVEVATGERLSTHELGLIEMVAGSSTDNSVESSMKSSLEYVNEPVMPAKQTVVEREVTVVKSREPQRKLWLNGKTMESRARERFTEPLKAAEAEELWAHDIACSRVHAAMLAETVSSLSSSCR